MEEPAVAVRSTSDLTNPAFFSHAANTIIQLSFGPFFSVPQAYLFLTHFWPYAMAFFGKSLKNPVSQIKKESVPVKPSTTSKRNLAKSALLVSHPPRRKASHTEPANTTTASPRKRRRTNLTPLSSSTPFGDESSDEDGYDVKSSRSASAIPRSIEEAPIDAKRSIRLGLDSIDAKDGILSIIHAADVASLELGKFVPALKASRDDDLKVRLYYPGAESPERYQLVFQKDKLDSVQEILRTVETMPDVYLTPEQADEFTDENTGIIRKLQRAHNIKSTSDFKDAIQLYNSKIKHYRKDGTFAKNLDQLHYLPHRFVQLLLDQIYDRAVSPEVDNLLKYKNGTDNIYGELRPPFISRIFKATGLKSDHIFLDLGSGCGNVVLQAALQVGCASWGCEMMNNACELAEKQNREFAARCRLWGIASGSVHLESGDFLENEPTKEILKKADVILVNNQAFTPKLNDKLKMFFLDLKDGAKVVSLKPFTGGGGARNQNDLGNIFGEVVSDHFYADDVSWTDQGGDYHIATRVGKVS